MSSTRKTGSRLGPRSLSRTSSLGGTSFRAPRLPAGDPIASAAVRRPKENRELIAVTGIPGTPPEKRSRAGNLVEDGLSSVRGRHAHDERERPLVGHGLVERDRLRRRPLPAVVARVEKAVPVAPV